MEQFDNTFRKYTPWLDNPYVSGILILFLITYASKAAPKLPSYISKLFDYTLFKLVMFFLITYVTTRNPSVSLIGSIALLAVLMILNLTASKTEKMEVLSNDDDTIPNAPYNEINQNNSKANVLAKQIDIMSKGNSSQIHEDASMILKELHMAEKIGELSSKDAKMLAKQIEIMASKGTSVLVARTEEGGKRMSEIAEAETQKSVSPAKARRMAAQVVVQEVVANPKLIITAGPNDEPDAPYFQNLWSKDFSFNTSNAMAEFETDLTNEHNQYQKMFNAKQSKQNDVTGYSWNDVNDKNFNTFSNEKDNIAQENVVPMELQLAKEVIKRKQVETDRRGGFTPTKDEIQNMCSQVIAEYRNNGSSCASGSCGNVSSRKQNGDVSSNDMSDTLYASINDY